eukprot:402561-Amphidinium_carterae.1
MDSSCQNQKGCEIGVRPSVHDKVSITCNEFETRQVLRSHSCDDQLTRSHGEARMRRTRQKERPSSSGRSRSARYVEEEVGRMMQQAEEICSFDRSPQRPLHRQREHGRKQQLRDSQRNVSVRHQERTGAREVKLEEADTREPLKRKKRATSELTPRSHKEHPD